MSHLVKKVLIEVLFDLHITEPNRIRNEGRRRGKETTTWDRVLRRDKFLGCHRQETKQRRKEKKNTAEDKAQERRKKNAMHDNAWACYVQNKLHHGQKPNPNYCTNIVKSSTQPRMHESMIIMLENAMHEHVRTNQQNPTQKFHRKLKNPKNFPKRENLGLKCMKCMKKEKKMIFRTRTKRMRLGLGWNLEWKRFLVKRKGLVQKRRERDWDIWVWAKLGWTSDIYRKTHLDKSRRYREQKLDKSRDIEEVSMAKNSR